MWLVPAGAASPEALGEAGFSVAVSEAWARLAGFEDAGPWGRVLVEEEALFRALWGLSRRVGAPAVRRETDARPRPIEVQHAGLAFPFDARLTVRRMAERGATLQDAVAAELQRTLARAEAGATFVQAVQAARPQLEFRLEGTQLWAATGAQTKGWPLCLQTLPAAVKPGTEAFERELRFACDTPPEWSDTTRACPCGAPAFLVRRLVTAETLALFGSAHPGHEMAVLETFGEGAHLSAAVVAIASSQSSFKRSLYLARRAVFLQQLTRRGKMKVIKVDTENNVADVLTKVLSVKVFARHRHRLLNLSAKPMVSAIRARRVRFVRV